MTLHLESREITIIIQALHERNEEDAEAVRKKIVSQRDEQLSTALRGGAAPRSDTNGKQIFS